MTDLSLTTSATTAQVAAALATKMAALSITPDNNDYAFVQVPTADATPTEISRIDRYKFVAGTPGAWSFEYSLNNSSFTAAQWAAINSGITSAGVTKLNGIAAGAQVNVVETVKVNGTALTPTDKAVNITVPTTTNQIDYPQGSGSVSLTLELDHLEADKANKTDTVLHSGDTEDIYGNTWTWSPANTTYDGDPITGVVWDTDVWAVMVGDSVALELSRDIDAGGPIVIYAEDNPLFSNDVEFTRNTSEGFRLGPNTAANPNYFKLIASESEAVGLRAGKLDSTSAAPAYSASSTYSVGDHCTYNGKLYVCSTAISTAEAWNSAHWTATDMTTPDATLDVTATDKLLRVVKVDGTIVWMQGYNLNTTSGTTLLTEQVSAFSFFANATGEQPLSLPSVASGKVGDFILDVTNPALDPEGSTYPGGFSDAATYAVDDLVSYSGKIYRCTTAVETAGDWTGSANWEEAWPSISLTGLDTAFSVVVAKGQSLADMTKFEPGTTARLGFSLTAFRVNSLPTWQVTRLDVENGGAQA